MRLVYQLLVSILLQDAMSTGDAAQTGDMCEEAGYTRRVEDSFEAYNLIYIYIGHAFHDLALSTGPCWGVWSW